MSLSELNNSREDLKQQTWFEPPTNKPGLQFYGEKLKQAQFVFMYTVIIQ